MNARHIAFTTLGGREPRGASHREEFRAHATLLQLAQQIVETDTVATDHHEVGQLKVLAE